MNDSLLDELENPHTGSEASREDAHDMNRDPSSSTPYRPYTGPQPERRVLPPLAPPRTGGSNGSMGSSRTGQNTPVTSTPRSDTSDVWDELQEQHHGVRDHSSHGSHGIANSRGIHIGGQPSAGSFKDHLLDSLAEQGRLLSTGGATGQLPGLRKHNMPHFSGFSLKANDGGNIPDRWGRVESLDSFFTSLYNYYYHKGLKSITLSGFVRLGSLFFTIILSTFLLGCVDWAKLAACGSDEKHGCDQPFSEFVNVFGGLTFFRLLIFFYGAVFLVYWVWSTMNYIATVKESVEMHSFYHNILKIDTRKLQTMEWNDVIDALVELQKNTSPGAYKLQIELKDLSVHDIACRIMRKENYLISCLNMNVFKLGVWVPTLLSQTASHAFFARNMEWNLHFCLLNHMFDRDFHLDKGFFADVEGLRKRFALVGVLNFFFTPFVLLFMIVQFMLKHTSEWHSNKNYLGPRQWSPLALWRFREYNELPHVFDKRIALSYSPAQQYQNQFPQSYTAIVARGVAFITGSIIAVLLFMSIIEEDILLKTHIHDRQLLWYLSISTALFAFARSFVPGGSFSDGQSAAKSSETPEEIMLKVSSHTHYFPIQWKHHCHSYDVRDEFHSLFQYKAQLFFEECLSVLITPYLLCFSFPLTAERVLEFVQSHTVEVHNMGAVCRQSRFDFKYYNQQRKKGPSTLHREEVAGKMEKSFINFKETYPNWQASAEGEEMLTRLGRFRDEQQSLHLEKSLASLTSGFSSKYGTNTLASGTTMRSGSLGMSVGMAGIAGCSPPHGTDSKDSAHRQEHDGSGDMEVTGHSSMFGPGMESLSLSQQLFQSQAIHAALQGTGQQENSFYWLEKYYQETGHHPQASDL